MENKTITCFDLRRTISRRYRKDGRQLALSEKPLKRFQINICFRLFWIAARERVRERKGEFRKGILPLMTHKRPSDVFLHVFLIGQDQCK